MNTDRRFFLKRSCLATSGFGLLSFGASRAFAEPKIESPQPTLEIGENIAVAETHLGKVQGYRSNGVNTYLGIPYGAPTSGANRFKAPREREAWTDIRPTVFPGPSAPQHVYPRKPTSFDAFLDHWNYDEISEDCLYLNLWTPAIDKKKRPVLVWLHGGGFSRGNGLEQDGYHGENLSKDGDIVFCSLNHRLGALGFTDLSGLDSVQFKDSGNVGMLDIIFALRWIRRNSANFGGDPDNVTIMGQSGGGSKVCVLEAMPEARGLFHKAVALSGSTLSGIEQSYSQSLGQQILNEANIDKSRLSELQEMPWQTFLQVAESAAQKVNPSQGRGGFRPVADGIRLPTTEFFKSETGPANRVPTLFCTTFHEWTPTRYNPAAENATFAEVESALSDTFGNNIKKIVAAYRDLFADAKPVEIWALILSSRSSVVNAANAKKRQDAPVYMAWFGWPSPLFDGRLRSFHCLDISFWFRNTDRMATHTGGTESARTLSRKMSSALLAFMRSGSPNCDELPKWPEYEPANGYAMILNDHCEVQADPDRLARGVLES